MKVIQLQDSLYDYLVHLIESAGVHPREGIAIYHLWEAVTKNVTHIDDAEVRRMAAAGAPQGQSPVAETEPDLIEGGGQVRDIRPLKDIPLYERDRGQVSDIRPLNEQEGPR
jgi:hypothetical protein